MNGQIVRLVEQTPVAEGVVVRVVDPLKDPRWDAFVAGHARGSVYHLGEWLGALADAYGHECACLALEDEGGRLRGVLPLARKSGVFTGRRLTSLPVATHAGPLADDPGLEAALIAAACRLADESGAKLHVQMRSADVAPLGSSVRIVHESPLWVVALPVDVDEIPRCWKRRDNLRRYVRKAAAAGLTARAADGDDDLRAFYSVYLRTASKHRAVPHSLRLFECIHSRLAGLGAFQLMLLEREGEVVGGCLNLVWHDTLEALFLGIDDRRRDLHPSHALHWEVLRMACLGGVRRVTLGAAPHGSSQAAFKEQWGAKPVETLRLDHPAANASDSYRRTAAWDDGLGAVVWRRTPQQLVSPMAGFMRRRL